MFINGIFLVDSQCFDEILGLGAVGVGVVGGEEGCFVEVEGAVIIFLLLLLCLSIAMAVSGGLGREDVIVIVAAAVAVAVAVGGGR